MGQSHLSKTKARVAPVGPSQPLARSRVLGKLQLASSCHSASNRSSIATRGTVVAGVDGWRMPLVIGPRTIQYARRIAIRTKPGMELVSKTAHSVHPEAPLQVTTKFAQMTSRR